MSLLVVCLLFLTGSRNQSMKIHMLKLNLAIADRKNIITLNAAR